MHLPTARESAHLLRGSVSTVRGPLSPQERGRDRRARREDAIDAIAGRLDEHPTPGLHRVAMARAAVALPTSYPLADHRLAIAP